MSPFSESTLQIRLMLWIGASSLLMQMGPLRRDLCVLWIVGIRFCEQDCEASKCVVVALRSGGGNMGKRGHDAFHLSFLIRG